MLIRAKRGGLGACLLASVFLLPGNSPGQSATCIVESVTDGDTIRCGGERIRLLLIDAPEENQARLAKAAQAFLEAVIPPGSEVQLVEDVENRDQYDRRLAYVFRVDGHMVNLMMVRQGFAVPLVVPPNVRYVEEIRAAAESARKVGLGLWALEAFDCPPAAFREGSCGAAGVPQHPERSSALPLAGDSTENCDPSYPDGCIPPPPPDLDCGDVPYRAFRVVGSDPHRFDGGGDGIGCERD